MASKLREIADALAASLEAQTWSLSPITIERKNWVQVDPEQMQNPVVYVVPGSSDVSRIGRVDWQSDHAVNIYVGRHVATDSDIDGMYDLTNQIMTFTRSHALAGVTSSPQTVTVDINPDDALNERNVWRAVITATYRVLESDYLPVG
jgi:hypothetical protein